VRSLSCISDAQYQLVDGDRSPSIELTMMLDSINGGPCASHGLLRKMKQRSVVNSQSVNEKGNAMVL
jgi:hypothetical protein